MNPLSPNKILRNLENGFYMTHHEQTEAADYIRQLQASNQSLSEGMVKYAEEIVKLRRDLHNPTGFNVDVTELAERIKFEEREACAKLCEDGLPMGMGQTIGPMMCAAAIRSRNKNDVI